jgi:hypothetical protein
MLSYKKNIFYNNLEKNDLNLSRNLTNQMVHCLLIKITNQMVYYSTNKKDH